MIYFLLMIKKYFFFEAWIFKLNLIVIQFIWGENIFKKKCVAVLSLLIVFFICLSSVNAMDLNDTFANCNNANFNHKRVCYLMFQMMFF